MALPRAIHPASWEVPTTYGGWPLVRPKADCWQQAFVFVLGEGEDGNEITEESTGIRYQITMVPGRHYGLAGLVESTELPLGHGRFLRVPANVVHPHVELSGVRRGQLVV